MRKIKLFSLCICAFLLSSVSLMAQDDQVSTFDLGSQRLGIGVGVANISTGTIIVPPVYVSYEKGIFCVGDLVAGLGIAGEYGKSRDLPDYPQFDDASLSVEAIGKIHFPIVESFEINGYVGIGYGSYGCESAKVNSVCRSIGVEGLYRLSGSTAAFVNLESNSLPGKAGIRAGISFAL